MRGELIAGLEHLAETLLGAPSLRKPRTWRWGKQGSLVLELHGRKRGAWHSKESEQGGGPFHLIAYARSCSMAEAIAYARDWTGGTPDAGHDYKAEHAARQAERDRKAGEHAAEDAQDEARRVGVARKLWAESAPIGGTVAEGYLVEVRRIPSPAAWPDCTRFHAPTRSLIVGATLADGSLQAVQRIRLAADATKVAPAPDSPVKVTNGVLRDAAVRLPAWETLSMLNVASAPLLLAEGPETGLSVWAATGHETWIALGGMAGIALPAGRRIVVCRDDDPKHSPADRKMVRAVETWRSAGHQVAVATPWPFRQYDKTDFNDTLKLDGVVGIRRRIEAALNPGSAAPARLPIRQVRDQLRVAVGGFFDAVREYDAIKRGKPALASLDPNGERGAPDDWDFLDQPAPESPPPLVPPVHALRVDVGSGKTLASIREAIRLLAEIRRVRDDRAAGFSIPTHALGDELAAIFQVEARGTGLTAAVWRGMSATDPDSPSDPMCRNLESVQDARDAMLDVFKTTCRRKLDNGDIVTCPFFHECGYQKQRESEADLWIVPHEMAFMEKPTTIGKLAFLVVDEAIWQDGLEGVHGRPTALSLDAIGHLESLPGDASLANRLDRDRLEYLRNRLLDALRPAGDGPVTAESIEASDLTLDNTREAYRLEWARFVDPGMHPGMTKAERREAVRQAAINATIPRLASVWEAMTALLEDGGPQRSGWAALAIQPSEDGPVRVLHLKGRKKIRKGWQVPTLLIDATLNVDLIRSYWPDVELTAELLADAPHQTIRQVVDRAYSKSAIEPLLDTMPGYSPEEAKRRQRGLRAVHAIVNREARRHGGQPVLLVTQKAVREALPDFGPLTPCIDLAHHNAVAGRDQWRDVRGLIVVGRTQPAPASVERLAEALTGRAVDPVDGWYARGDGVRHTSAAGAVAIEADRHPDPVAEAIRWQVCEGELVQIIGRGRGVNRTEDDPLDILVLTDAPLPLPVTVTMQAADLAPNPEDLMVAAGGVLLENPRDAADAYPALWPSKEASRKAFQTAKVGSFPYKEILLGETPNLRRAEYQRAGRGQQSATAWFDPELVPDIGEWLASRLGALAWCHDGDGTDPPSPPNPSARQDAPRSEPPTSPAEPPWHDVPAWSADDVARFTCEPEHHSDLTEQSMPEPEMRFTGQDQPGLDPAAVYRRGALEPPHADQWTIRQPSALPIAIRSRPGARTQMPRAALVWPGVPPAVRFEPDASRVALLPEHLADVRRTLPEPGD